MNHHLIIPPASGRAGFSPLSFGLTIVLVAGVLLFWGAGRAESKEFKIKTTAREYQVEATLDRYPLVIGDNHIELVIKDGSGRSITDAAVLVNYYMPPMPRMVPMNYKTEAHQENDKYQGKLNIIMAGPWYVKIIITRDGQISTTKFNIDAQ